ncbi:ubiquitin carboxyl-terminal hydrolase 43-like [Artemia franciscana]|uniref:ubiquitin carboxyl-terminal hydrolase 43-like n=1 Tax=Artemia franciscana TaxID=6661 RepID=UPI0032DB3336
MGDANDESILNSGWSLGAFTLPRHPLFASRIKKHQDRKEQKRIAKEVGKIEDAFSNGSRTFRRKKSFRDFIIPKSQGQTYQEYLQDAVDKSFANYDDQPDFEAIETVLPERIPAVIGLKNHGNTCFINSIVQCLSHTDLMAKYLVMDNYKNDLCHRKKSLLPTKLDFGTKGELTECLASLVKSLWIAKQDSQLSLEFKQTVEKHGNHFRGGAQHDAQEFLMWLLDKVHEDLNSATKTKYKKIKNTFGRSDEEVAAETLRNHLRCNASFIQRHFQAQFRSALSCPNCLKHSSTFDPFLCLSVPILRKTVRHFYVTVLYLNQQPREVRLGITVDGRASIQDLKAAICRDSGIDENEAVIVEIDNLGFHQTFLETSSIDVIDENTSLYALELPKLNYNDDGASITITWCNVLVNGDKRQRFGGPFVLQLSRETSYEDLQKLFLKEMSSMITHRTLVTRQKVPLFQMKVVDLTGVLDLSVVSYLDHSLQHPLYMECVDTALSIMEDQKDNIAGPTHIKLELEWDKDTMDDYIVESEERIEDHSSVKRLTEGIEEMPVTLEECLDLYTRAERLSADDAWYCPTCNRKQEGVKTLGLWSLPDILVVHLKRFRQNANQRTMTKLSTVVDFPIHALDMSSHVSPRSPSSLASSAEGEPSSHWLRSNWSRLSKRGSSRERRRPQPIVFQPAIKDQDIYDLYAVCNHHGTDLQGGHYTASCRNPVNGEWYSFDDTHVTQVHEKDLITSSAYLLFYQRRTLASNTPNYSHWSLKLPELRRPLSRRSSVSRGSKSSTDSCTSRRNSISNKKILASQEHLADINGDWGTPELPRRVFA